MAVVLKIPKLGLTMTEGTISKWFKSEGDYVEKGEALYEIATDKLTNEIYADESGYLRKIIVKESETAPVSAPVGVLANKDENIENLNLKGADETKEEEAVEVKEEHVKAIKNNDVLATPAAKKLARENNVNLKEVVGKGPKGIIVEKNVAQYLEDIKKGIKVSPVAKKMAEELNIDLKSIEKQGRIMKADVLNRIKPVCEKIEDKVEPLSRIRKVIAKRMLESWNTSPAVNYNMEVEVTKLKELRENINNSLKSKGIKISYNHILMKVCAKALSEFPYINGSIDGDNLIIHGNVNIGIAVALERGLIVPNVKNVQDMNLAEIALKVEELIEKAKKGGLDTPDITGGTFTISNLGSFGINSFTPIINQPEVAILGVNAMIDKPVIRNGEVVIRTMMNLSLTADHRAVDGADAAKFLARIKELIENPYLLLI